MKRNRLDRRLDGEWLLLSTIPYNHNHRMYWTAAYILDSDLCHLHRMSFKPSNDHWYFYKPDTQFNKIRPEVYDGRL